MLFVNMIWAHAFLLSDKIPSLSRCLFLLASVRQPYKSPAVGRYGDLKFQAFTAALPPAGDLSIIQSCIDIRKIQLKDLRDLFAVVSQDPYLFLGGIEENINLSKKFNQQQISLAMKASGVSEFMRRMSDEDKKQIGQNGARLSGGEKQKIAVARALLKDAPVIILDEATANFDVESDQYLHNIIVNEMKNKTVIMITHHYENLQGMDRVYRLENGKTMEYQGNLI